MLKIHLPPERTEARTIVNKKSSRIERLGILDMKKPDYYNLINDLKKNISSSMEKNQKNLMKIEKH